MFPLTRLCRISVNRFLSTSLRFVSKIEIAISKPTELKALSQKNLWIWEKSPFKGIPQNFPTITPITVPSAPLSWEPIHDFLNINEIYLPTNESNDSEKEAARLIVIRKRKMKKHKLKKLRKRMKFEWAKVRQRRELRKEKAFQAVLIAAIKDAEKFSAEKYVEDKIKQATETPIPRFWKGKRLPEFIIREKLGLDKKKTSNN